MLFNFKYFPSQFFVLYVFKCLYTIFKKFGRQDNSLD